MRKYLFGDRERFGLVPQPEDPCWIEWQSVFTDFYYSNQKQSIGDTVNNAGYTINRFVDFTQARVLEVGPGEVRHLQYIRSLPKEFVIVDIQQSWLDASEKVLREHGVSCDKLLIAQPRDLSVFPDNSFDIILSFYSLEHIYPLAGWLEEISRLLRNGGLFVGAIPCEGGIAWGLGRYLTSRRWLKRHTTINPDKVICWEHPNYASTVLRQLDTTFVRRKIRYWPWRVPLLDLNLVASFMYAKAAASETESSADKRAGQART